MRHKQSRAPTQIQKDLIPRRRTIFNILSKHKMRLMIPDIHEGSQRSTESVESRYARLNPREPGVEAERRKDPYLEFSPPFSATESPEFSCFVRWMFPGTAKRGNRAIFERGTRVNKKTGKLEKMVKADSPADNCAFFSNTSKMYCGSWSIPAGGITMGGTCPSANTIRDVRDADPETYNKQIVAIPKLALPLTKASGTFPRKLPMASDGTRETDEPLKVLGLDRNICGKCYASKGSFGNANIQLWQMARFAWAYQAVEEGTFADEMTAALRSFLSHAVARDSDGQATDFFRIHDSGDFFSPEYLMGWAQVAANLPDVLFWAPTRVWMLWPKKIIEAMKIAPNLILRPSALQFDDPAPIVAGIPTGGSTAHVATEADPLAPQRLGIAEWDCPAYALDGKTCNGAMDASLVKTPEQRVYIEAARDNYEKLFGEEAPTNCRVCWTRPETTINYHAH